MLNNNELTLDQTVTLLISSCNNKLPFTDLIALQILGSSAYKRCFEFKKQRPMSFTNILNIRSTHRATYEAHFWLNGYVNKQNCRI